MRIVMLLLAASVVGLAGVGVSLVSVAWSQSEPARTVTVDVTGATGPAGPPGPQGPAGPPGGQTCPQGFSLGHVVFIQQGKGPTEIVTCLKDE